MVLRNLHLRSMYSFKRRERNSLYALVSNPRFLATTGRRILFVLASCLTVMALLCTNTYYRTSTVEYRFLYSSLVRQSHNSLNDDQCHLPNLDPFDPSIQAFLQKPSPLECKRYQAQLTYITDDGKLSVNKSALELEHYSTGINCQYRCFDKTNGLDDVTLTYGPWTTMDVTGPLTLSDNCSFIDVACSRSFPISIPVYSNTHFRIIEGNNRAEALTNRSSVLLFVLDSVSRSNFIRNLPKTFRVLNDLYGATVFEGYTKVGDNSLPNAVAFLAGRRVAAAGYASDLEDDMSRKYYDDWPFIWKEYAKYGYSTLYAEDYPNFNLFQYMSNGFKYRPVDYYFRPFWVHVWDTFLHRRSTHLCYGNVPKHRLQLAYVERVLKMRKGKPIFAFNWMTELGHDWMNQINRGDHDLADFFTRIHPYLHDSLLVVLSDHGHRFDPIRQTVIGRVEERTPFFALSLPSSWKNRDGVSKIRNNLIHNSRILTSPFDLHATLLHYLSLNDHGNRPLDLNGTRGSSLFAALPRNRQCEQAHVPEEFCVCQQEMLISNASTDEKVKRAVDTVIDHLNQMLSQANDRCARLNLLEIRHAQTFLPNLKTVEDERVSILYGGRRPTGFYINYRVTFVTIPGDAIFESAVRYSFSEDTFSVIGDVNRINRYGDQSKCVKSVLLRKFCYCQNFN